MANFENRHPGNAEGEYFVDTECIACEMCAEVAPSVFRKSDEGDQFVVFQQPATDEDRKLAEEALEGCPSDAIGRKE